MDIANTEQAQAWSQQAQAWLELEAEHERVGGPPGQWAMDLLELKAGQRVLDVGCGAGETTLELAARVRPGGSAVGVDITPGLLDEARQRAADRGAGNVDYVYADAQVQDLGEREFDAAYSRFGVMFFADPVAAFANIRRALRPGGALSFVCWQSMSANGWMLLPCTAVSAVTGTPVPADSTAPGPFSLADPRRVAAVLDGAGFSSVTITPRADQVALDGDQIEAFAMTRTRIGAARAALADADDETRGRAVAAVRAALQARLQDGKVTMARGVLLVTAR
jgi:SAM-dependent methyltransferase